MQTTDNNATLLRLYYLQQLGITAWLPRIPLPGALAGEAEPVMELPAVAIAGMPQEKPAIVIEAEPPASRPASVSKAVVEETKIARQPLHEAAAASAVSSGAEMSPFQILFAVPVAGLAVAVQIPSAVNPALRDGEAKLLANILRWLGVAWPRQSSLLQFRWPLPGLAATGAEQAGKGLQAFLHQAALEQPFQRLLVFGNEPVQALRACDSGAVQSWQGWYTHSLAELLAVPSLKHDTWQSLLPLRAQLAS